MRLMAKYKEADIHVLYANIIPSPISIDKLIRCTLTPVPDILGTSDSFMQHSLVSFLYEAI